jgi:hypothetical protein
MVVVDSLRGCFSWRQTKKPYAARAAPASKASIMHMEIFPSRRTNLNENWSAWNGGPLSGNPLTTKIRRTRGFAAFGPGSLETVQCEGV